MIRRILIAALPLMALMACGMPEGGEFGDDETAAMQAQVHFAAPANVQVGAPQAVFTVVQTVAGPRVMLVATSVGTGGDTVSSSQDPIPVRDGPGNPPPDKQ